MDFAASEPGIVRIKRGKGFAYRLPDGNLLRSAGELERIRKHDAPGGKVRGAPRKKTVSKPGTRAASRKHAA